MYKAFFKRLLDIIIAFGLMVLSSPIFIFLTLCLFLQYRGSPFFHQDRPGKNRKTITVIKFKSMNEKRDAHGNLLPDVQRLTTVGNFLRRTSLDELPQLINVLRGDMSLVGPRPLLHKYLPLYTPEQQRRHEVRPGITGWAQVNGRNGISWKAKFSHDLYYVDNLSFWLDVKILGMTVCKVLKREGINQSSQRPMEPFNGNN